MDDIGGIAIILLIWIVGAVFDQKRKQERRRKQKAKPKLPTPVSVESVSAEPRARLPDASQREGSKLEQVLRQLNPELAELADQALAQSREKTPAKPKRQAVVERRPVEPVPPAPGAEDDFRAKAERAIARRRLAAEEYSRDRSALDHAAFHQAARTKDIQEVSAGPPLEAPTLEQAIIWREILGPPKAMTIDDGGSDL